MKTNKKTDIGPHPETATQRFLASAWEEVLKEGDFGIDSDFFELGGDSLLALQVYDRIRLQYKREFPIFDLSGPSTIRHIASIIDAKLQGAKNKYRALQRLRQGDEGVAPLFLVHGGDGNARVFQRLAKHLDPRIPLFAFRWTGWDGRRGDASLDAMADTYLREMADFYPSGSFRLGGYCIGGLIVLEMARRLGEQGRPPEGPLYIWDTPNIKSPSYHLREPWYAPGEYVKFKRMVDQISKFRRETKGECESPTVPSQFTGSYELLRRYPALYTFARAIQIRVGAFPFKVGLLLGKSIPIKWRWIFCMANGYFAIRNHKPQPYAGDVVYFRSDVFLGRDMNLLGWWSDPFLGFGELCSGSFIGYVVGGNHVDVLSQPIGGELVGRSFQGLEK